MKQNLINNIKKKLNESVSSDTLAIFRIVISLVSLCKAISYLTNNKIKTYYVDPKFFFSYFGDINFIWENQYIFYIEFTALALIAWFVIIGLWYRISNILLFVILTHLFIIDKSLYQDYDYLLCLCSFMLMILPCNAYLSYDNKIKDRITQRPKIPKWMVYILYLQLNIPYFFEGITKLNPDWLNAQPLTVFLYFKQIDFIVRYFDIVLFAKWMSYIEVGYLLLIPILLWIKKTKNIGICIAVIMNIINNKIFYYDTVHLTLSTLSLLVFLDTKWIHQIIKFIYKKDSSLVELQYNQDINHTKKMSFLAYICSVYIVIQLVIPLRPFVLSYKDRIWFAQGNRFSWQMRTHIKNVKVKFVSNTVNKNKNTKKLDDTEINILKPHQKIYMEEHPNELLEFVHHVNKIYNTKGYTNDYITAVSKASLNGRQYQAYINPNINLLKIGKNTPKNQWITALETPLYKQIKYPKIRIRNRQNKEPTSATGKAIVKYHQQAKKSRKKPRFVNVPLSKKDEFMKLRKKQSQRKNKH